MKDASTCETESGTLVVVIPTADGLVIAADSRGMVGGRPLDIRQKLQIANTTQPTVFAITGAPDFPASCPPEIPPEVWFANPLYVFRSCEVLQEYFAAHPEFRLTATSLNEATCSLAAAASAFLKACPAKLQEFANKNLSYVVICQAGPDGLMCRGVCLAVDGDGQVSPAGAAERYWKSGYPKDFEFFGSRDYVLDNVLNGEGQRFLVGDAVSTWNQKQLIAEVRALDGARLAAILIKAAEQMTALKPIPGGAGIGGPVRCLLVTASDVSTVEMPSSPDF